MASKRLGPPSEDGQDTSNKKLKIEVPAPKYFCGISDITPQTATHPPQPSTNTTLPTPADNAAIATTEIPTTQATKPSNDALYSLWVVIEHFQPSQDFTNDGYVPMVKILGLFNNSTAALEHAEEHVRALRTVTTEGIRPEPQDEDEDERDDDEMSVTSVYERKLEIFRGRYEGEEESEGPVNGDGEGSGEVDDEHETGGEEGLVKAWMVRWGNVTEVRVEKREVFESKAGAGYFTPLPIEGEDDRD